MSGPVDRATGAPGHRWPAALRAQASLAVALLVERLARLHDGAHTWTFPGMSGPSEHSPWRIGWGLRMSDRIKSAESNPLPLASWSSCRRSVGVSRTQIDELRRSAGEIFGLPLLVGFM
jgi:hypothetical protein